MKSNLKERLLITSEDYLEGETISEIRHEFIDGVVYAMAGGTLNHNTISLNIASQLKNKLHGSSCRPFMADVKVRVRTLANESFYYPDVVVSCAPDDNNPQYLEQPTTIIEVLSESTERIDRKEKFLAYTSLPSLEEYILVSQDKKLVTIARRADNWKPEIVMGDDFQIELSCAKAVLDSTQIYAGVDL